MVVKILICFAVSNSTKGSLVHPCVPRGYKLIVNASDEQVLVASSGNFSECKSEALTLLKRKQGHLLHLHFPSFHLKFHYIVVVFFFLDQLAASVPGLRIVCLYILSWLVFFYF